MNLDYYTFSEVSDSGAKISKQIIFQCTPASLLCASRPEANISIVVANLKLR